MLDTSTVILLGELDDPSLLPDECVISAVTLAELSIGPHGATTAPDRAARQAHLQQAEADVEALAFDAASARAFGRAHIPTEGSGAPSVSIAHRVPSLAWLAAVARRPTDFTKRVRTH